MNNGHTIGCERSSLSISRAESLYPADYGRFKSEGISGNLDNICRISAENLEELLPINYLSKGDISGSEPTIRIKSILSILRTVVVLFEKSRSLRQLFW